MAFEETNKPGKRTDYNVGDDFEIEVGQNFASKQLEFQSARLQFPEKLIFGPILKTHK